MPLTPGSRLGVYEVTAAIGEGGMGQVYRARDTKLNRDVALKVLPDSFADDPDRLARFTREAQTLAALNHPNIAAIYGLEESAGAAALVMELVDGEDLSQRIARGAIPIDEALLIARQISEALEAAHEQGIIHRDLKPANIKVRPDGTVKVLDFGLARAIEGSGGAGRSGGAVGDGGLSMSPTMISPARMSGVGVILGTAGYMAPEQARGALVDKRADLWALGVVMWEMLTGSRLFGNANVPDTLASVLRTEPAWTELPAETPAPIRRLLRRCLDKDRKRRLDSAAAARLEIDEALSGAGRDVVRVGGERRRAVFAALATGFVVGGVLIGIAAWTITRAAVAAVRPSPIRFAIDDTDNVIISRANSQMALSPDGRRLAFVGYGNGGARLWIRQLDTLEEHAVANTDGATGPGWSPDGQSLAFFANGQMKKLALSGGRPEAIRPSHGTDRVTQTWGADGTILYRDSKGFWRVPPGADSPVGSGHAGEATEDADWPSFLPDGRHFFISVKSNDAAKAGTFVAALGDASRTRVLGFPAPAQYVNGHLLFVHNQTLYAQPFDLSRLTLTAKPTPLVEKVSNTFNASNEGTVVYLPLSSADIPNATQLFWMDRSGRRAGRIEQVAGTGGIRLSPDGNRLAMQWKNDVWVLELTRGVLTRLTSEGGNGVTWSPDGRQLFFHRPGRPGIRGGKDLIFGIPMQSAGRETMIREPGGLHAHPTSVSSDGEYLIYEGEDDATDIWALHLKGDLKATPVVRTPSAESQGSLSPDGHWLAYTSNMSGQDEIYAQTFPDPSTRTQISASGGIDPVWRRDGRELFYVAPNGSLMAVPVESAQPRFGTPTHLFQFYGTPGRASFDVTPDGQRFIVRAVVRQSDPSLYALVNWPSMVPR